MDTGIDEERFFRLTWRGPEGKNQKKKEKDKERHGMKRNETE